MLDCKISCNWSKGRLSKLLPSWNVFLLRPNHYFFERTLFLSFNTVCKHWEKSLANIDQTWDRERAVMPLTLESTWLVPQQKLLISQKVKGRFCLRKVYLKQCRQTNLENLPSTPIKGLQGHYLLVCTYVRFCILTKSKSR